MKLKLALILIIIEVLTIIFLWKGIVQKRTSSMNTDKNMFNIPPYTVSREFRYYYEPTLTKERNGWDKRITRYQINDDKLNDRYNYPIQKAANVFRIVTLGDSFTFGENVDTKDNWTELLEDSLNTMGCKKKFEVINLGMYGYGTEYEVERYRRRGVKYKPDLVIWLFIDFGRFNEEIETVARTMVNNKNIGDENISIYRSLFKSDIANFAQQETNFYWAIARKYVANKYTDEYISTKESRQLDIFNTLNEGKVVYATFLNGNAYFVDKIIRPRLDNQNSLYFYLSFGLKDGKHFLPDNHPNIEGHKKISDEFLQMLLDKKLIKCEE